MECSNCPFQGKKCTEYKESVGKCLRFVVAQREEAIKKAQLINKLDFSIKKKAG